jgi:hypothetical protein
MAAPSITHRQKPSGTRLDDGYQTLTTPSVDPNIEFWEKTVQPPGFDGGEPIDTTTMHNIRWRSMRPRVLIHMTPAKVKAAYDPRVYTDILAILNVQCSWSVHMPDASAIVFWGFLKDFEADANEEGKQPEATLTIIPTNQDPGTHTEESPLYIPSTGTSDQ